MTSPGKVPKEYRGILNSIKRKVKRRGLALRFSVSGTVHSDETDISGSSGYYYFSKEIAVSIDRPLEKWMEILIHESCHMDQDFDKKVSNETKERWTTAAESFFEWIKGAKQMNSTQLDKVVATVVELEKDCEIRSVAMIKKWKLPLDIKQYIKAANLYLYMHQIYKERRQFFSIMKLTDVKEALDLCPNTFQEDYTQIPKKLKRKLDELSSKVNS